LAHFAFRVDSPWADTLVALNRLEGDPSKFAGVIFLQSIQADPSITFSVFEIFHDFCGNGRLANVTIATTKWSIVPKKLEVATERTFKQDSFYVNAVEYGAHYARHRPEYWRSSGQEIVARILQQFDRQRPQISLYENLQTIQHETSYIMYVYSSQTYRFDDLTVPSKGHGCHRSREIQRTFHCCAIWALLTDYTCIKFINAAGVSDLTIGNTLRSCTWEVNFSNPLLIDGHPIILLDTPGFNDTEKGDIEILTDIAGFLGKLYVLMVDPYSPVLKLYIFSNDA
jgi:hypothetical protein